MKRNSFVPENLTETKKQGYQSLSLNEMMMVRGGGVALPDPPPIIR